MIDLAKLRTWDDPGETICADAAAEIAQLRAALSRLLLNYGAALPEDKKDQRSIAEARKALGLDEQPK